jgi:predicted MPP superfamily phosphohydrolase
MPIAWRHIPDIVVFLLAMGVNARVFSKILSPAQRQSRWGRALGAGSLVALGAGLLWTVAGVAVPALPSFGLKEILNWWALAMIGAALVSLPFPEIPERVERRAFLSAATRFAVASPLVITGIGSLGRKNFQVREVDAPILGLPADLEGLRIVQLSDIHLGPLLERRDLARAVDMANELRADIAVVTGDLITRKGDPLDDALAEIARLKSGAGIYACNGNHEIHADAEEYCAVQGRRLGIRFLRQECAPVRFGSATIQLVGVDYQRLRRPYLVNTEKFVESCNVNILLSHNPDVFPVARRKGFALTLAGHTHGGQVNVEILERSLNVAAFFTPFTKGLYHEQGSSLYVSAGIGTVGIPVRVGAPAEVSLVKLCAT